MQKWKVQWPKDIRPTLSFPCHRIIISSELEEIHEDHPAQLLTPRKTTYGLNHVSKSIVHTPTSVIQTFLEYQQVWGMTTSLGSLLLPLREDLFPNIQSETPLMQLQVIPFHPIWFCKEPLLITRKRKWICISTLTNKTKQCTSQFYD